jgi:hypothetical protein
MTALRFPDHFPPTSHWKKFFIGVRWLGPDLSFFKALKQTQARREEADLMEWGGGKRQAIATAVSATLADQLGWKSRVFLPQDAVAVAFHGPSFEWTDPESAFEAVVKVLEVGFDLSAPEAFWQSHRESTLGELIDSLLSIKKGRVGPAQRRLTGWREGTPTISPLPPSQPSSVKRLHLALEGHQQRLAFAVAGLG